MKFLIAGFAFTLMLLLPVLGHAQAASDSLITAIWSHDEAAVRRALDAGADPNIRSNDTAILALALQEGFSYDMNPANPDRQRILHIIQMLLDAGADPAVQAAQYDLPLLHRTAYSEDTTIVRLLLTAGANPDATDQQGNTVLGQIVHGLHPMEKASEVTLALMRLLLDTGADPNASYQDAFNQTPLLLKAVKAKAANVVRLLLEAGADPNMAEEDDFEITPLIWAAEEDYFEIIRLLLDAGADPNLQSYGTRFPLTTLMHDQYDDAYLEVVQYMLDAGADPNLDAALVEAAEGYHPEKLIPMLLKAGADPNQQGENGKTALMTLVDANKNPALVRMLLDAGADPDIQNALGETALKYATGESRDLLIAASDPAKNPDTLVELVQAGNLEGVRAALNAGTDPDLADDYNRTALMYAVAMDNADLVRLLLEAGADPNAKTAQEGQTPLMILADIAKRRQPDPAEIQILLDAEADPNAVDHYGVTTLTYAVRSGLAGFVRALLNAGADVNAASPTGYTPLMDAKQADVIRLLLAAGADIDAQNVLGKTALTFALEAEKEDLAMLLIEAGADEPLARQGLPRELTAQEQALLNAFRQVDEEQILHLLREGANPDVRDPESGCTPLLFVLGCGGMQTVLPSAQDEPLDARPPHRLVQALLDAGADPSRPAASGRTPLIAALASVLHPEVMLLLEQGADVNAQDEVGWTALIHAISSSPLSLIKRLLDAGANPNHETPQGYRPLYTAIFHERANVVPLLLDHGADVHHRYPDGSTPLHAAVHEVTKFSDPDLDDLPENLAIIQALLHAGADPTVQDKHGRSPRSMAQASGIEELMALFN